MQFSLDTAQTRLSVQLCTVLLRQQPIRLRIWRRVGLLRWWFRRWRTVWWWGNRGGRWLHWRSPSRSPVAESRPFHVEVVPRRARSYAAGRECRPAAAPFRRRAVVAPPPPPLLPQATANTFDDSRRRSPSLTSAHSVLRRPRRRRLCCHRLARNTRTWRTDKLPGARIRVSWTVYKITNTHNFSCCEKGETTSEQHFATYGTYHKILTLEHLVFHFVICNRFERLPLVYEYKKGPNHASLMVVYTSGLVFWHNSVSAQCPLKSLPRRKFTGKNVSLVTVILPVNVAGGDFLW